MPRKNGRPPGFRIWSDDFLTHIHLNDEPTLTVGARAILWAVASRQKPPGSLPDDQDQLRQWARVTADQWAEIWPRLRDSWRFDRRRNRYMIRRIVADARYRERISAQRKETTLLQWERRKGKKGKKMDARASAVEEHRSESRPNPGPVLVPSSPRNEELSSPNPSPEIPPPAGFFASLSEDQSRGLKAVLTRIERKHPKHFQRLEAYIVLYVSESGAPFEVVIHALQSIADHEVDNPIPYFKKICNVETPNFWERKNTAGHEAIKAQGPVSIGMLLAQAAQHTQVEL